MSTTIPSRLDESTDPSAAGAERSEPGGRAKRGGGGGRRVGRPEFAAELKALLPDELLDELLAGASTEEEITGRGGLLSQEGVNGSSLPEGSKSPGSGAFCCLGRLALRDGRSTRPRPPRNPPA